MRPVVPAVLVSTLLAPPVHASQAEEAMLGEINRLRGRVIFLEDQLRQRDELLSGMGKDLKALADALGDVKERLGPAPLGGPFLDAPPPPSDTVGVAKQLVLQPRLILLDEPFGALDAQTRLLMGEEVLRLWRRTGATVFLITHALDEAAMLSDRIGVMFKGKIIKTLPVAEATREGLGLLMAGIVDGAPDAAGVEQAHVERT